MIAEIQATILSDDPAIILTWISTDYHDSTLALLGQDLKDIEVFFLVQPAWSLESTSYSREFFSFIRDHERSFPLHRCCIVVSTLKERSIAIKAGISAFVCHQNAFVDPDLFRICRNETKQFSAVYNAAITEWKRHYLCISVDSLALIYYCHDGSDLASAPYFKSLKRSLPNARFMNEELASPPHGPLSAKQINSVLNQSKVGLCLSAYEGAMYASVEYLLAGLPVVSTPSVGGRDAFFDADFAEIVEPNPSEIAAAIDRIAVKAPAPEEIRSRTIRRQQAQLDAFVAHLDRLVRKTGGPGFTQEQFKDVYCNKMQKREPIEAVISRLSGRGRRSRRLPSLRRMREQMSASLRSLID